VSNSTGLALVGKAQLPHFIGGKRRPAQWEQQMPVDLSKARTRLLDLNASALNGDLDLTRDKTDLTSDALRHDNPSYLIYGSDHAITLPFSIP